MVTRTRLNVTFVRIMCVLLFSAFIHRYYLNSSHYDRFGLPQLPATKRNLQRKPFNQVSTHSYCNKLHLRIFKLLGITTVINLCIGLS